MCIPWPNSLKASRPRRFWPSRNYTPPIGFWESTPEDRLSPVALHRFLVGRFGKRTFSIELYDGVYTFTVPRRLTKAERREISRLRAPVNPPTTSKILVPAWARRHASKKKSKGKEPAKQPLLARNEPNWGKSSPTYPFF